MSDTNIKKTLSVIATTSDRIKDLVIKNGQLIFLQDLGELHLILKIKESFITKSKN